MLPSSSQGSKDQRPACAECQVGRFASQPRLFENSNSSWVAVRSWYGARVVGTRLPYSARVLCDDRRHPFTLTFNQFAVQSVRRGKARMGVCRVPPGPVAQDVRFAAKSTTSPHDHPMARKAGPCRTHDVEMQAPPAGPDTDDIGTGTSTNGTPTSNQ